MMSSLNYGPLTTPTKFIVKPVLLKFSFTRIVVESSLDVGALFKSNLLGHIGPLGKIQTFKPPSEWVLNRILNKLLINFV